MDTLTSIKTRRSIRNYKDEILDVGLISEIVECGLYAPSAHNQQARKYFIVSKKEDGEFLAQTMEYGKMLLNAGGCVLACFDNDCVRSMEFVQQDMGASIQSILLAAYEKGVGTVRLGLYPHEVPMKKISQHFNLPENIVPFALISMGIPDGDLPEKNLKSEGKIEIL